MYAFVGCVIGTLVGMLPGLGPLAGISLLLPATFGLNPIIAIVLLAGVYYGAMYGGSTTSILMRIPGEAASVMTCVDGYAMTQHGRAGPALAIAAIGSFVAGTLSVIGADAARADAARLRAALRPARIHRAADDGAARARLHERRLDARRRWRWPALGLLLGMIGIDAMSGYTRFSFGMVELGDGIGIVPVAVGPVRHLRNPADRGAGDAAAGAAARRCAS